MQNEHAWQLYVCMEGRGASKCTYRWKLPCSKWSLRKYQSIRWEALSNNIPLCCIDEPVLSECTANDPVQ